jgi:hypothetical protein
VFRLKASRLTAPLWTVRHSLVLRCMRLHCTHRTQKSWDTLVQLRPPQRQSPVSLNATQHHMLWCSCSSYSNRSSDNRSTAKKSTWHCWPAKDTPHRQMPPRQSCSVSVGKCPKHTARCTSPKRSIPSLRSLWGTLSSHRLPHLLCPSMLGLRRRRLLGRNGCVVAILPRTWRSTRPKLARSPPSNQPGR